MIIYHTVLSGLDSLSFSTGSSMAATRRESHSFSTSDTTDTQSEGTTSFLTATLGASTITRLGYSDAYTTAIHQVGTTEVTETRAHSSPLDFEWSSIISITSREEVSLRAGGLHATSSAFDVTPDLLWPYLAFDSTAVYSRVLYYGNTQWFTETSGPTRSNALNQTYSHWAAGTISTAGDAGGLTGMSFTWHQTSTSAQFITDFSGATTSFSGSSFTSRATSRGLANTAAITRSSTTTRAETATVTSTSALTRTVTSASTAGTFTTTLTTAGVTSAIDTSHVFTRNTTVADTIDPRLSHTRVVVSADNSEVLLPVTGITDGFRAASLVSPLRTTASQGLNSQETRVVAATGTTFSWTPLTTVTTQRTLNTTLTVAVTETRQIVADGLLTAGTSTFSHIALSTSTYSTSFVTTQSVSSTLTLTGDALDPAGFGLPLGTYSRNTYLAAWEVVSATVAGVNTAGQATTYTAHRLVHSQANYGVFLPETYRFVNNSSYASTGTTSQTSVSFAGTVVLDATTQGIEGTSYSVTANPDTFVRHGMVRRHDGFQPPQSMGSAYPRYSGLTANAPLPVNLTSNAGIDGVVITPLLASLRSSTGASRFTVSWSGTVANVTSATTQSSTVTGTPSTVSYLTATSAYTATVGGAGVSVEFYAWEANTGSWWGGVLARTGGLFDSEARVALRRTLIDSTNGTTSSTASQAYGQATTTSFDASAFETLSVSIIAGSFEIASSSRPHFTVDAAAWPTG